MVKAALESAGLDGSQIDGVVPVGHGKGLYVLGKDGKPRELHTEKACDVIRSFTDGEVEAERFESLAGDGKNVLASCRYFTVCLGADGNSLDADGTSFHSVLCFDGAGKLEWSGGSVPVAAGESIFIPAGLGSYRICGGARVLVSRT